MVEIRRRAESARARILGKHRRTESARARILGKHKKMCLTHLDGGGRRVLLLGPRVLPWPIQNGWKTWFHWFQSMSCKSSAGKSYTGDECSGGSPIGGRALWLVYV